MKCIQVSIDGKVVCNAGHSDMAYVTATLNLLAGDTSHRFIVSGKNDLDENPIQLLRYLDLSIKEEQKIELKIVNIDKPDAPNRVSSFGTHQHFIDNKKEHFCSFCGKNENDVKKMLLGVSGNICNYCIKKHYSIGQFP